MHTNLTKGRPCSRLARSTVAEEAPVSRTDFSAAKRLRLYVSLMRLKLMSQLLHCPCPRQSESSWACSDARFQSTEHPVHGAHTGCSVTTSSPDTRPVAVITRVSPAPTSRTSSPDLSCPPPPPLPPPPPPPPPASPPSSPLRHSGTSSTSSPSAPPSPSSPHPPSPTAHRTFATAPWLRAHPGLAHSRRGRCMEGAQSRPERAPCSSRAGRAPERQRRWARAFGGPTTRCRSRGGRSAPARTLPRRRAPTARASRRRQRRSGRWW
mmetsp:Transcript_21265/g.52515  ORF Transcript_21265/g.52515 Transcript_21265/m.52515 type:complete len:266 (-) Transcript_21265:728-1525(-)